MTTGLRLIVLASLLVPFALTNCGSGNKDGNAGTGGSGGGGGLDGGGAGPEAGVVNVGPAKTYSLAGVVQKGPFINGTPVTIRELDGNLVATGRTFSANILDDTGAFALPGVQLVSPYVELSADGFFFNEIDGSLSTVRIQLEALADARVASRVNVNLLSHLEKERAKVLASQGLTLAAAKAQAQAEVLGIFGIGKLTGSESETLDIAKDGDANAILLAVSAMVLGYHTPAELMQLLSSISTDLRLDGRLDTAATGSELVNMARLLNLPAIRANLGKRYADLGVPATIGNFEKYVSAFLASTGYVATNDIKYPAAPTQYGPNLLALDQTTFSAGKVAIQADLPPGTSLWIRLHLLSFAGPNNGMVSYPWYTGSSLGSDRSWDSTIFDLTAGVQDFVALQARALTQKRLAVAGVVGTGPALLGLDLQSSGSVSIEYYENASTTPTRTKVITWTGPATPDGGVVPDGGGIPTVDAPLAPPDTGVVDPGPCGGLAQPCCPGNVCKDPTASCNVVLGPVPTMQCQPLATACGLAGQPCCAGNICKDTFAFCASSGAMAGTCQLCGMPGQTCCPGNTCSDPNFSMCASTGPTAGTCQMCGMSGQPCCADNRCSDPGAACQSGICCGSLNGTCCPGNTCPSPSTACAPSGPVDAGTMTCQSCGQPGGPCCAGNACASPMAICQSGICCGDLNGPCCEGNTCTSSSAVCAAAGTNMLCQMCGMPGQPCCTGSVCGFPDSVCSPSSKTCATCGRQNEPCCSGGTCPGLGQSGICSAGTCTCTPPAVPASVIATPGNGQVVLSWTASPEAAADGGAATSSVYYTVYRTITSGSRYSVIPTSNAIGTSATDTSVANGTTYYYVVTASKDSCVSAYSAEVAATPHP